MNVKALLLLLIVSTLAGAACGEQARPAAPASPTAAATATPAPGPASATVGAPTVTATAEAYVPTLTPLPTPVPTEALEPVAAPEAAVQEDAILVKLGREPPTMDPHLTVDTDSARYIVEVYGGLVTIEAQNPRNPADPQLEIVGDLAEAWDVSDGGRTYTFHLREEARFHDGKPVTAQDFKWSLERAADPATESPNVGVFLGDVVGFKDKLEGKAADVKGVRVIDGHTLSITADAPKAFFLAKLTYPTAFVLDRENVEGNPAWFREPNGTGPFRLAEYVPGEVLRLQRNDYYHLGAPKLAEVRFILSGGDALLMYENDEIQVTGVGLLNLEGLLDPMNPLSREMHLAPPGFDISYIGMNAQEPPFDDPKVRQALNYAIDKETLANTLLQGQVSPARGILPPGFPGYTPDIKGYTFDPEKARRLMEESKYGRGLEEMPRITMTLPGSFGAPVSPYIELILQTWREVLGLEMDILQTEWAVFLRDLQQRRFQIFGGLGWVADYPDPENFLDVLFHSESSNNHTGYSNQEVDRLLEQARVEMDEDARFEIYHRVEAMIMEDAPWVPLWHGESGYVLLKPYVKDYFLFPLIIPKLRYVYMTER